MAGARPITLASVTVETLESLRGSFNRRLRAEGKADRTLVLYGQSITYFSHWLAEEGLPADLENLTRDDVLSWLEALRTRKVFKTTDGVIEPGCSRADERDAWVASTHRFRDGRIADFLPSSQDISR
jgi:hypothetical protein